MNQIKVDLKFKIGGQLKPGFDNINMGKYSIFQLPSQKQGEFKSELLLKFKDEWEEGQEYSNPEKEGEIILSWLSVVLRQKIKPDAVMMNHVGHQKIDGEKISFNNIVEFPNNMLELYNKLKSLPYNLLEKYIRACEVYQEALLLSNYNSNISFFLFIVCIECLSGKNQTFYDYLTSEMKKLNKKEISTNEIKDFSDKFNEEYGLKKNFIKFIVNYFKEWDNGFSSEEEFKDFLSSIYNLRSKFTHEGENLEKYTDIADRTGVKSVYTKEEGKKEKEIVGLNYLSKIVKEVLINFLNEQPLLEGDNIPKLASSYGTANLIAVGNIIKGQEITKDFFKHRK